MGKRCHTFHDHGNNGELRWYFDPPELTTCFFLLSWHFSMKSALLM